MYSWQENLCFKSLLALVLLLSCPAITNLGSDGRLEHRPIAEQAPTVKVFILMGQSNMVGMGDILPADKPGTLSALVQHDNKYSMLLDQAGGWAARDDVYYYDARTKKGSPLSALSNNGNSIGPELGFGFYLGDYFDEPVLILKSCIGNRSLGWDLLPPGSERYTVDGKTYAGYQDTPDWWIEGQPKREVNWYAGKQYDDDLANAKAALARLDEILPGYSGQGYEITGFVWWQGHKDQNPVHASRYEQNLARLIPSLRRDFEAPKAKFVLATIGFNGWKLDGPGKTIAEAQLAIADRERHPQFAGNVRAVESRDLWRDAAVSPKDQGHHYNRNAETYLEVGFRLGEAMTELLRDESSPNETEAGNLSVSNYSAGPLKTLCLGGPVGQRVWQVLNGRSQRLASQPAFSTSPDSNFR